MLKTTTTLTAFTVPHQLGVFFPVNLVLICHTLSIKQPPGWWSFWLFPSFFWFLFCCLHCWIPVHSTCLVLVTEGAWLHSCGQSCGVLQWDGQAYGVTLGQKHMGALRFAEWSLDNCCPLKRSCGCVVALRLVVRLNFLRPTVTGKLWVKYKLRS